MDTTSKVQIGDWAKIGGKAPGQKARMATERQMIVQIIYEVEED